MYKIFLVILGIVGGIILAKSISLFWGLAILGIAAILSYFAWKSDHDTAPQTRFTEELHNNP